jgi:hypothetical protein
MVPLPSMPMEGNDNSINLCAHPSERTALEHMLFFPSTFPFDAKHKVVQASNIILSFLLGQSIPDEMVFGTAPYSAHVTLLEMFRRTYSISSGQERSWLKLLRSEAGGLPVHALPNIINLGRVHFQQLLQNENPDNDSWNFMGAARKLNEAYEAAWHTTIPPKDARSVSYRDLSDEDAIDEHGEQIYELQDFVVFMESINILCQPVLLGGANSVTQVTNNLQTAKAAEAKRLAAFQAEEELLADLKTSCLTVERKAHGKWAAYTEANLPTAVKELQELLAYRLRPQRERLQRYCTCPHGDPDPVRGMGGSVELRSDGTHYGV